MVKAHEQEVVEIGNQFWRENLAAARAIWTRSDDVCHVGKIVILESEAITPNWLIATGELTATARQYPKLEFNVIGYFLALFLPVFGAHKTV